MTDDFMLRTAARSNTGLVRKNNQDSGYAGPNFLLIADGMGGHAGGDVASAITVSQLEPLDTPDQGPDALDKLRNQILTANERITNSVSTQPELAGMGTTVTALLRSDQQLALAHIGDSRAYLLRGGILTQITADHTFVQMLVDEGRITPEEAETHPQRSVVMRVLGDVGAAPELDLSIREAKPGDRWMLCSDGLTGFADIDEISEKLEGIQDPGACADALIDLALAGGGGDNVTVVIGDVVPATDRGLLTRGVPVGSVVINPQYSELGNVQTPTGEFPAAPDDDEDTAVLPESHAAPVDTVPTFLADDQAGEAAAGAAAGAATAAPGSAEPEPATDSGDPEAAIADTRENPTGAADDQAVRAAASDVATQPMTLETEQTSLSAATGDAAASGATGAAGSSDADRASAGADTADSDYPVSTWALRGDDDADSADGSTERSADTAASTADAAASGTAAGVAAAEPDKRPRGDERKGSTASPSKRRQRKAAKAGAAESPEPDEGPGDGRRKPRRRGLVGVIITLVVIVVLAAAGLLGWRYIQSQYYVTEVDGRVAVFSGVSQDLGPFPLSSLSETTDVQVADLTPYSRERLGDTIPVTSKSAADHIVSSLRQEARQNTSKSDGIKGGASDDSSDDPAPSSKGTGSGGKGSGGKGAAAGSDGKGSGGR